MVRKDPKQGVFPKYKKDFNLWFLISLCKTQQQLSHIRRKIILVVAVKTFCFPHFCLLNI